MKTHPLIRNVSDDRNTGSPPAVTCVFDEMALTLPPCGHSMTLDVLSKFATAFRRSFPVDLLRCRHFQSAVVYVHFRIADLNVVASSGQRDPRRIQGHGILVGIRNRDRPAVIVEQNLVW